MRLMHKKEKKPLDPVEQKKLDIKEWKKQGLTNDEPHLLPTNAYTLFVQNRFNDHYQECKSLGETSKHLRAEYQNYSTAEKQVSSAPCLSGIAITYHISTLWPFDNSTSFTYSLFVSSHYADLWKLYSASKPRPKPTN